MKDATTLILEALNDAPKIVPSGKNSMLALAARALDPDTRLNKGGICIALGLHPALVVPISVVSDLAGDTLSRRDVGASLFPRLTLHGRPAVLSGEGKLQVAVFCAEQLTPAAGELAPLLERTVAMGKQVLAGQDPDPVVITECTREALELQRTKVVHIQKGTKSKLGVPDEEACKRRGAQAIRALLDGISDGAKSPHLCPTVAGEVAWTLGTSQGMEHAVDFCADLAGFIDDLPAEMAEVKPGNGG